MHARELVDLAAVVATEAPVWVRGLRHLSPAGAARYWSASRTRLDRWAGELNRLRAQHLDLGQSVGSGAAESLEDRIAVTMTLIPLAEEILTGEILTRVWCAFLSAWDQLRRGDEVEPLGRSIYRGHLEVRNRLLSLMLEPELLSPREADSLNRLRRASERWTDLLLGQMLSLADVTFVAHSPSRAEDFARGGRSRTPHSETAAALVRVGLSGAFSNHFHGSTGGGPLNRRIAQGILACLDPTLFDSSGVPQSHWWARLLEASTDAQVMIDDLLRVSDTDKLTATRASRHAIHRWQRRRRTGE
jgi:hypothetical protein